MFPQKFGAAKKPNLSTDSSSLDTGGFGTTKIKFYQIKL